MIALALDLAAAYLLAKWRASWWAWLPTAAALGIVISFAVNLSGHFLFPGSATVGETMARAIGGAVWNPIVCIGATWFARTRSGGQA